MDDVARGRALFTGNAGLKNGAVPCLSCHTARGAAAGIGGGLFARDLTHVFARLGDEHRGPLGVEGGWEELHQDADQVLVAALRPAAADVLEACAQDGEALVQVGGRGEVVGHGDGNSVTFSVNVR